MERVCAEALHEVIGSIIMKVLHVIPSVATADGGPARAVVQMVKALRENGIDAEIATTDDAGHGNHMEVPTARFVQHLDCPVIFFPRQIGYYKASFPLGHWLRRQVRDYDLVHIHALFSYASWAASRACRLSGVPYLVRPLGLLNRYGMEHRRPWLKRLSFHLIERPLLNHCSAIHYTSQQEADEASRLRLQSPFAVIPLGIDLQPFENMPDAREFIQLWPEAQEKRVLLFLSRIDAKKGLDLLLPAFASVHKIHPDALLVIAGSGDPALEAKLKDMAIELGIQNEILWTGFLDGREKLAALSAAEIFTLPSRSENFGIALLEAMAAGKACVTTVGVALAHDATPGSLNVVPLEVPALANALIDLLNRSDETTRLGEAARKCARGTFSSEATVQLLLNLYKNVLPGPRSP